MIKKLASILIIISFTISLISCEQKNSNHEHVAKISVSTDSLINLWNTAWNTHDSIGLANMFTENAIVVFSDKNKIQGTDSIMIKWIGKNLPVVANLKTEKITSSVNKDLAYYTGNYSLEITANESSRNNEIGSFTSIWKLQNDQSWKIELMFFGVHEE